MLEICDCEFYLGNFLKTISNLDLTFDNRVSVPSVHSIANSQTEKPVV